MIDDERPDTPEEGGAPEDEQPAAGDESLTEVEDTGEQITDAPETDAAEEDGPNESAPGHVDPGEAQDAEPSAEPPAAEAPNEGAPGDAEPAAEGEPAAEEPAAEGEERPRRERRRRDGEDRKEDEVVPGARSRSTSTPIPTRRPPRTARRRWPRPGRSPSRPRRRGSGRHRARSWTSPPTRATWRRASARPRSRASS